MLRLQFGVLRGLAVGMIYKDGVKRRRRGLDFWECKGGNKGSRCMPSSTTKGCVETLLTHPSQPVLTCICLTTVFLSVRLACLVRRVVRRMYGSVKLRSAPSGKHTTTDQAVGNLPKTLK
jgi:hypothetical protein